MYYRTGILLGSGSQRICGGRRRICYFYRAIPYNYYALLTIVMMFAIVLMKVDFGPMAIHEANAMKGDIYTSGKRLDEAVSSLKPNPKGKVIDLIFPVIVLVICCITGMIYTGGFFSGTSFVESFLRVTLP